MYARRYYVRPEDPRREEGRTIFFDHQHLFHFRERNCLGCMDNGACNLQKHLILADAFDLSMPLDICQQLGKTEPWGQLIWPCPKRRTTPAFLK